MLSAVAGVINLLEKTGIILCFLDAFQMLFKELCAKCIMEICDTLCIPQSIQNDNSSMKTITSPNLKAKADLLENMSY